MFHQGDMRGRSGQRAIVMEEVGHRATCEQQREALKSVTRCEPKGMGAIL